MNNFREVKKKAVPNDKNTTEILFFLKKNNITSLKELKLFFLKNLEGKRKK